MANFTINIYDLNECIINYKNKQKLLNESIDTVYEYLRGTEDAWADEDSVVFMSSIEKEKEKIETYITNINLIYKRIENFKENIDSVFSKYGYAQNTIILKYNDDKINSCINKLKTAYGYIGNALSYIDMCNFDNDFREISKVRNLKSSLRGMKNDINDVKQDINDVKTAVNDSINSAKAEISRISGFSLDIKLMEYIWQLNNPILNNFEKLEKEEATLNKTKHKELNNYKVQVDEDKVKLNDFDLEDDYIYSESVDKDLKNKIEVLDISFSEDIKNNEKGFSKTLETVNATAVYKNKKVDNSILDNGDYVEIFPDIDIPKRLNEK